jgi:hypothetical protein
MWIMSGQILVDLTKAEIAAALRWKATSLFQDNMNVLIIHIMGPHCTGVGRLSGVTPGTWPTTGWNGINSPMWKKRDGTRIFAVTEK